MFPTTFNVRSCESPEKICPNSFLCIALNKRGLFTPEVRARWMKVKKACQLHPREILLSVKGSQANWATRLKDSLETSRWMNSKNLYGTCDKRNYSQWGEDANDSEYCELRDSPLCLDNVTHHQEWEWVMNNVMLIGRDSHYYVRSGGLSKDSRRPSRNHWNSP